MPSALSVARSLPGADSLARFALSDLCGCPASGQFSSRVHDASAAGASRASSLWLLCVTAVSAVSCATPHAMSEPGQHVSVFAPSRVTSLAPSRAGRGNNWDLLSVELCVTPGCAVSRATPRWPTESGSSCQCRLPLAVDWSKRAIRQETATLSQPTMKSIRARFVMARGRVARAPADGVKSNKSQVMGPVRW